MKKRIAVVAVIVSIGVAGMSYAAGGWGKRGGNYNNCPMVQSGQYTQVDPALQEKRDAFLTETQEIRKEIVMKQAEKRALLRGDNPDPAVVSQLSGELFDLRASLRQKATEAGLPAMIGPMAGRGGPGAGMKGRGFGPGMDDQGFGPGKGRYGKGGRGMAMGNPGYMQNRF